MRSSAMRQATERMDQGWPSREDIAERAYELYMQRPANHGSPLEDWLAAERELTSPPEQPVGLRRRSIRRVVGPDLASK